MDERPVGQLETERAGERYRSIAAWPAGDVLAALVEGQTRALGAVLQALPALEAALDAALPRIRDGGRLVYAGAGTSGRLALLDAVELHPTFGWPRERAVTLLAGGFASVGEAQEGAEDDEAAARRAVEDAGVCERDVLIAVAASGRTPFTVAAARAARQGGALVVALANNPDSPLLRQADRPVLLRTGAEVIAGSTRLAAGTAQKIALNAFSSALMIALGGVVEGRMVSMRASNAKLRARARAMLVAMAGCEAEEAARALEQHGYDVNAALRAIGTEPHGERGE